MIATMALAQMGEEPEGGYEDYEALQVRNDTGQQEIDRLKRLIQDALTAQSQLAEMRAELERLRKQRTDADEHEETDANLRADNDRLRKQCEELDEELKRLQIIKGQLAQRADRLGTPPSPGSVRLRPGGSGKGLVPVFVECISHSILLYEKANASQVRIQKDEIADSEEFRTFLEAVKSRSKQNASVIFLIRPDGIPVYEEAAAVAENLNVRNGKLPVPGYGEIDLTFFEGSL